MSIGFFFSTFLFVNTQCISEDKREKDGKGSGGAGSLPSFPSLSLPPFFPPSSFSPLPLSLPPLLPPSPSSFSSLAPPSPSAFSLSLEGEVQRPCSESESVPPLTWGKSGPGGVRVPPYARRPSYQGVRRWVWDLGGLKTPPSFLIQ